MNGRHRWFREGEWPIWTFDTSAAEWRRLEWALTGTGIPITVAAVAAQIIADRTGCDLREAWDRLAFNLTRMQDGRWPPAGRPDSLMNPLTTMEMFRC